MATVIDITGKIKNEEKFIVWNSKNYKVDDRKNTILQAYAILNDQEMGIETIDKVMALLIGADAVKDFEDLSYQDYLVPFFAAMACVQNKTYEEIEATFRNAQ